MSIGLGRLFYHYYKDYGNGCNANRQSNYFSICLTKQTTNTPNFGWHWETSCSKKVFFTFGQCVPFDLHVTLVRRIGAKIFVCVSQQKQVFLENTESQRWVLVVKLRESCLGFSCIMIARYGLAWQTCICQQLYYELTNAKPVSESLNIITAAYLSQPRACAYLWRVFLKFYYWVLSCVYGAPEGTTSFWRNKKVVSKLLLLANKCVLHSS